jgi:UPF0755 protein
VRRVILGVLALLLVAVIALGTAFVLESRGDPSGRPTALVINEGESVGQAIDALGAARVIRAPLLFKAYAELHGIGTVQAGVYFLQTHESYGRALASLEGGPSSLRIVVYPGETIREIASSLAAVPGEGRGGAAFLRAVSDPSLFHSPFLPKGASTLEGLLYPETYFVDPLGTARELVREMIDRATQEYEAAGLEPATRRHGLDAYQLIVAASIVQREAATPGSEAKVARVILNRLARGMPLEMDSTVRYATNNLRNPITGTQLRNPSLYNTYVHPGLPPGPIGAVSVEGIEAVLHPAQGSWLYFVALRGHRHLSFFDTYAAQQAAIARDGVR